MVKSLLFLIVPTIMSLGFSYPRMTQDRIWIDLDRTRQGIEILVKASQDTKLVIDDFEEYSFVANELGKYLVPYRNLREGQLEFSLINELESHNYLLIPLMSVKNETDVSNVILKQLDGSLELIEEFKIDINDRLCLDYRENIVSIRHSINHKDISLEMNPFLLLGTTSEKVTGAKLDMDLGGLIINLINENKNEFYIEENYEFSRQIKSIPSRFISKDSYPNIDVSFTFRPFHIFGEGGRYVIYES